MTERNPLVVVSGELKELPSGDTLPLATTSGPGVAELATTTEAYIGTDTGRVITPEGMSLAVRQMGGEQADNLWPDGFFMSNSIRFHSVTAGAATYVQDVPYGRGGLSTNTAYTAVEALDVAVDVSATYNLSCWVEGNAAEWMYQGLIPLDVDGLIVGLQHCIQGRYSTSALTTLAAQLNPGATTVSLTSAANWATAAAATYERHFVWWPYSSAGGYVHADYTYSRNSSYDYQGDPTWASITSNTLNLSIPWAGPTLASGTKVMNAAFGSTYIYSYPATFHETGAWNMHTGSVISTDWRTGTAFARPVVLLNFGGTTNDMKVAGLSMVRL